MLEGYRKICDLIGNFEREPTAFEVVSYRKSRLNKKPDLKKVVGPTQPCDPEVLCLLQTCSSSDAIIERSFSKLKRIMAIGRSFAGENVKQYVIAHVNAAYE